MPLADLSAHVKIRLTGADRVRYLNGQCTNDVTQLAAGDSLYACVTNAKGKFEADITIAALEDDALLVDAAASLREDLLPRLDKYLIADDCKLTDLTDDLCLFHLFGPGSLEKARDLKPAIPGLVVIANAGRFLQGGADLIAPAGERDALCKHLPAPVGETDLNTLRISLGIPAWGAELTPDRLPPEAGAAFLARAVSYTKGCYVGQEIISRMKSAGKTNRQLVLLVAEDSTTASLSSNPLQPGQALYSSDQNEIGALTSTSFDPILERPIALAFVKPAFADPGTELQAAPGATPLTVHTPPLHQPSM